MKRWAFVLILVTAGAIVRPVTAFAQADPAVLGQWSSVMPWPMVGVHAQLLKTGKVLVWEEGSTARVWNPANGLMTAVPNPWVDLLCAGHTFLADGRFITLGGWDRSGGGVGLTEVDIFDPTSQAWSRAKAMAYKRWYPTATILPNGRILATSGDQLALNDIAAIPEIYDPTNNTWTSIPAATNALPVYPFLYVLPDGRVISAGTSEVASDTQILNLSSQTWSTVDSRVLDGGSVAMFQPGKFMKAGSAADSGDTGQSAKTAYVLDMAQPNPAWRSTAPMAYARSFLNLTPLPDGTVLATGGATDRTGYDDSHAVLAAELWSPVTETWTTLASMQTPRLYHSTALLLQDARVLVAGGGADAPVGNHPNAEIYSPPYLFKGPRPTITSTPGTLAYGGSFAVATPDGASIGTVSLVAPGSVTHSFDQNQRFLTLDFQVTPGGLTVVAPASASFAPPGYYLLFIVNNAGVPSVGAFVNLPVPAVVPPVTVPNVFNLTQAAATSAISGAGLAVWPVTTTTSATVLAGSVISQSPLAGTSVAAGSAVSLVVSSGPPVTAPNVVNLTQAAATSAITSAGLSVGAVTLAASSTVPAGSVVAQNPSAGTQVPSGSAVSLVISTGPAAFGVDNNLSSDGAGTRTITGFNTTSAGDLLVAFVGADGPAGGGQTATVSGAGLSWSLVRRGNVQPGTSEIWKATATGVLSDASITSQLGSASYRQSLTVVAFAGASGTGATNAGSALTGAPTVSLTTTQPGSFVYGVGNDWNQAIARTVPAGQVKVHEWLDTVTGDTYWVQARVGTVATAGTIVTLNDTAPTNDRWNFTAVEIVAAANISVPSVVNLAQAAATSAITGAGLVVGTVTTATSATVPAGSVISQTPLAGVLVAAGSVVNLVVSSGPPAADTDGDGVVDSQDNCTLVSNATQLDADGDGYGNICDADLNNSGLVTAQDNTMLRTALNTADPVADLNGSGLVTTQDNTILRNRLNTAPGPSGHGCGQPAGSAPCP